MSCSVSLCFPFFFILKYSRLFPDCAEFVQDHDAAYNSRLIAEGSLFFEEGEKLQVSTVVN